MSLLDSQFPRFLSTIPPLKTLCLWTILVEGISSEMLDDVRCQSSLNRKLCFGLDVTNKLGSSFSTSDG